MFYLDRITFKLKSLSKIQAQIQLKMNEYLNGFCKQIVSAIVNDPRF